MTAILPLCTHTVDIMHMGLRSGLARTWQRRAKFHFEGPAWLSPKGINDLFLHRLPQKDDS